MRLVCIQLSIPLKQIYYTIKNSNSTLHYHFYHRARYVIHTKIPMLKYCCRNCATAFFMLCLLNQRLLFKLQQFLPMISTLSALMPINQVDFFLLCDFSNFLVRVSLLKFAFLLMILQHEHHCCWLVLCLKLFFFVCLYPAALKLNHFNNICSYVCGCEVTTIAR